MKDFDVHIPWPDWVLEELIGRGQYGAVYRISRTKLGITEYAAMKMISIPNDPQQIATDFSCGYDKDSISEKYKSYLDDIIREYQLMMTVKGNPHIVRCDDVSISQHDDEIGWDVYIRMELLNPFPFYQRNAIEISDNDVIRLGIDICDALITCEKHNIIHRDVKPSNILVSDSGEYKLGDFGVSRSLENENTYGTKGIGTYDYMSPEVYKGNPYGCAADIYSLGMVLYWLLNGRTYPFLPRGKAPTVNQITEARNRRFSGEPLPDPISGSKELIRIVLKACEYNPDNRFRDAEEMKSELDALVDLNNYSRLLNNESAISNENECEISKEEDSFIKNTSDGSVWNDTSETVGKNYGNPDELEDIAVTVGKEFKPVDDENDNTTDNVIFDPEDPRDENWTQISNNNHSSGEWIRVIIAIVIPLLLLAPLVFVVLSVNRTKNAGEATSLVADNPAVRDADGSVLISVEEGVFIIAPSIIGTPYDQLSGLLGDKLSSVQNSDIYDSCSYSSSVGTITFWLDDSNCCCQVSLNYDTELYTYDYLFTKYEEFFGDDYEQFDNDDRWKMNGYTFDLCHYETAIYATYY